LENRETGRRSNKKQQEQQQQQLEETASNDRSSERGRARRVCTMGVVVVVVCATFRFRLNQTKHIKDNTCYAHSVLVRTHKTLASRLIRMHASGYY
jgi:hypothetical protein